MYFLSRFKISIKNSDKNYQTKIDFLTIFTILYFQIFLWSLKWKMKL